MKIITLIKVVALAAMAVLAAAVAARAAGAVSPNDAARFLAGMAPAAESPLAPLTRERAWQQHAHFFDSAFGQLDRRQLARIRAWSGKTLTTAQPTLFYMFSGPDFLYADSFFPRAKTYVLSGLEPVGAVPDLTTLARPAVGAALHNIENSLSSMFNFSFFITRHMRSDLKAGQVNGTLPILYVFLARSGKTIHDVGLVTLDERGTLHPEGDRSAKTAARGVRIVFSGSDGEPRTLYYFSTDLSNGGVKSSGFLAFCATLAPGDGLIKSASYLLHSGGFSTVREFLIAHAALVVQDDSGIPLSYYEKNWQLRPFGRYLGPIGIFPGRYQAKYAAIFRHAQPIDFGIGYRWRANESNLLVAAKTASPIKPADSAPSNAPSSNAEPRSTERNSAETANTAADGATNSIPRAARRRAIRPPMPIERQRAAPRRGLFDWFLAGPGR